MKSFSDLPNEILREILSYLALEKSRLCQLARTSQLLSILARPFMTKDIDFTKFEVDGISRRYRHLIRNIERDPSIARSVRTVTMLTSSKDKVTNLSHRLLEGLQSCVHSSSSETQKVILVTLGFSTKTLCLLSRILSLTDLRLTKRQSGSSCRFRAWRISLYTRI